MKKLIFILSVALMSRCAPATHEPVIVTSVHEYRGGNTKYWIDVNGTGWTIYTNHKYQVGDTIK